jgi:hypothetical protein
MVQHPIARIQALIGELQDASEYTEHESQRVQELWLELENQIVMLASASTVERIAKANAYDRIAGIISTTSPPHHGLKETPDADTDETSGRGHSDRGGSDGERTGDQAGTSALGDRSTETD